MINLLLPEDQNAARTEYRRRVLAVAGTLALAFLLIIFIIAGSLYWFIRFRQAEAGQALETAKRELAVDNLDQLASDIKATNDKLKRLRADPDLKAPPSEIIARLVQSRGRVILQKITYLARSGAPVMVSLAGKAPTRQEFLSYLEILQNDPLLAQVDSPVKNLIQEKNLSFTLELTLK